LPYIGRGCGLVELATRDWIVTWMLLFRIFNKTPTGTGTFFVAVVT
jgi:hypothetical protein